MTIRIESVHPDANSTVAFDVKPIGKVPYSSIAQDAFIDVSMHEGSYRAEIDQNSMQTQIASRRFVFTLYVNQSSLFSQGAYAYEIDEDATGVFNDTLQSINIHFGEDRPPVMGTVTVPLHSPYGAPNAFSTGTSGALAVEPLHTGSETSFTLTLTNNLQWLGATLGTPTASVTCDTCLRSPIGVHLSLNQLRPEGQVQVTVTTNPNMWKAMGASSRPAAETYDAVLNISIPFTAEGGSAATQTIAVPIKFSPPAPMMGLSVVIGTLLGAFLRAMLLFFSSRKWDWHEFVVGLVVAALSWLVALLIFSSGNTAVKVFGITFDPTQLMSAFVLCVLAGGGPALMKLLENSLPKMGGKDS
ncbi:MAG TPA: hypothetical protein VHX60_18310 [Acidobacteriaceae bacterium]|nr:hypothetical protein [Acidobacteriaceae bacterium]